MKLPLTATLTACLLGIPFVAQQQAMAQVQRLTPQVGIPNTVRQVQSNDSYRVNELEEKIRNLNGKVEELNFLLLQMQEKLRKMEEDNEGRFQELEDKHTDLGDNSQNLVKNGADGDNSLGKPEPSGDNDSPDVNSQNAETKRSLKQIPRALGTLTFDKDGNVIDPGSGNNKKLNGLPDIFNDGVDGGVEAAEFGATPNEVFKAGRRAFDSRDYIRSQQAFAAHLKAWPKDPNAGQVKYYLGESFFWQKDYYRAADMHLDAHNNYPDAKTAADNLLGLGLALAGLNQREVACATYAEVLNQYPDTKRRLGKRIKDEQAAAKC